MLRKIAKFFLWFFGIIGLLIIGFFIYLYIAFSPPFGCDPELRNDACDLKNWGYERKFSNTKANPFPQNLTPKPIFLEASNVWFPTSIEPAYVYIADEHGVWLRYNDGLSQDYFLGKDMPSQYYLYSEDDFSPSEEVRKKEKFYRHKAWNITLKDSKSEIYKQTAHKITRQYIGSFDLHSNPGRTVWFPSNIWENFATISKLQTPLNDTFPHTINRYTEITPEKNGKFRGDKVIVPEDENIYDITTAQGEQKIRISNMSKWPVDYKKQKAVCGEKFCLFLFTDTNEKNKYCGEITNETEIVFLNLEQKFTSTSYSNSPLNRTRGGRFGLKEGYGIDDIVSFEMIPTEFAEYERKRQPDDSYKNVPTGKNFIDYELRLYAKDGEIVNEYCDWYYMHKPIKTVE